MQTTPDLGPIHTLLYIEDNPADLKLVEQIIVRHANIRMLTAVNGNDGVEIARTSQLDVILMDINLPDISGFKALKILRSDSATARIPIIALSANATPLNIESGLEEGFFRYLTKPIKVNEFTDALDAAWRRLAQRNRRPGARFLAPLSTSASAASCPMCPLKVPGSRSERLRTGIADPSGRRDGRGRVPSQ